MKWGDIKEALRDVMAWWPLWVFIVVWLSPFVSCSVLVANR